MMRSSFVYVRPHSGNTEFLRGGSGFLDTKLRLHKWKNCSIVKAEMPVERSRSHETVTQESYDKVQSESCT